MNRKRKVNERLEGLCENSFNNNVSVLPAVAIHITESNLDFVSKDIHLEASGFTVVEARKSLMFLISQLPRIKNKEVKKDDQST